MDALPANRTWQPSRSHGTYQHEANNITQSSAPDDGQMVARNMLNNY